MKQNRSLFNAKRLLSAIVFLLLLPLCLLAQSSVNADGAKERQYLIQTLTRIADPVLTSLSKGELRKKMPIESTGTNREQSTYLEAFGRLLSGLAPWLELGADESAEGKLRKKYIDLTLQCIKKAVDPSSPDFMNFNKGRQPLVDAAFFAEGLLRTPTQLWAKLDATTKAQVIAALKSSRVITPSTSNWLLFSGTVEAALQTFEGSGDRMRVDYAVKQHIAWYKGDGMYGDGPEFHFDYYNSFVIQPMLLEVWQTFMDTTKADKKLYNDFLSRSQRYAAIQERLISPEGTFPAIGRSLAYRFGAFHLLSKMALMRLLPKEVAPQQVRAALYAVIKRQIEMPETFDKDGWLRVGFTGHQLGIGETYISTGSLYLCSEAFLILGLPETDAFWQGPDKPWTQKKAWAGEAFPLDHALKEE